MTNDELRCSAAIKIAAALLTMTSADHDYPNLDYQRPDGLTVKQRIAKIAWDMANELVEERCRRAK